jgi:hypothetical protein
MKKKPKELANRISGFELPFIGGGISWTPQKTDIEVARNLITFLEDRRVLYAPYKCETAEYVIRSIIEIRKRITADLEILDPDSSLQSSLRALRAACRKFLTSVEFLDGTHMNLEMPGMWHPNERDFYIALGELRSTFGWHLNVICVQYDIEVEESLVKIFPVSND